MLIIDGEYQITTKNVEDLTNVHYKLVAKYPVFVDGGSTYKCYIEEPNDGKLTMTVNPSTLYTLGPNNTIITGDRTNVPLSITFSFESTSPEDNNKEFVYKIFLVKIVPEVLPVKPTAYKSYGANLLPSNFKVGGTALTVNNPVEYNGATFTFLDDGRIEVIGKTTVSTIISSKSTLSIPIPSSGLWFSSGTTIKTQVSLSNTSVGSATVRSSSGGIMKNNEVPLTSGKVTAYRVEMPAGSGDCIITPIIACKAIDYKSYITPTIYTIPGSITSLEGYGEANPNNSSEYNYIDGENEQFVQTGRLVDGVWVPNESPVYTPIDFDPIIDVEENGYIELVTDTGYAAPMTATFQTIYKLEV